MNNISSKSKQKRGVPKKTNQPQIATLVFSNNKSISMADKALYIASDKDQLKRFVRENGCIHCIPKHLKRKLSEKSSLFIFKDGSSLVTDPKAKNGPISRNEEETIDFLKAKPSKNEIFFKIMQMKKLSRAKTYKNERSRGF